MQVPADVPKHAYVYAVLQGKYKKIELWAVIYHSSSVTSSDMILIRLSLEARYLHSWKSKVQ